MRFARNAKLFHGQLDAAPVASVFFLLVLFLMVQSSLVFLPGVRIELPETGALPGVTNATVVVAVDAAGQCYFENRLVAEDQLQDRLTKAVARLRGPVTLVVQADADLKHSRFVRLCELARAAGIPQALVATRPQNIAETAGSPGQR